MTTAMAREIAEAPDAVARMLGGNRQTFVELGAQLRARPPAVLITSARGSSDNAALYLKYLVEILLGVPCSSIGASVVSVYGARLQARGALAVTISQSGQSPDIVALQEAARAGGALTVAMVNAEQSPAAIGAELIVPLNAGPEKSVAATKSFIASLAAGAALVAHWQNDPALIAGVEALPEVLHEAVQTDWDVAETAFSEAQSLYVLGRGPGLPIAMESALKLKETCAIHAESYSTAEVMHGPLELVGARFPILVYAPADAAIANTREAIAKMRRTGAQVVEIGDGGLRYARTAHPLLDPISMIASFYRTVERIALRRGRDPDHPKLLNKVTETL